MQRGLSLRMWHTHFPKMPWRAISALASVISLAATAASTAEAAIFIQLESYNVNTPVAGQFEYIYRLQLEPGFSLFNANGNSLTLFDFAGLVGVPTFNPAAANTTFTVSTPFSGVNDPQPVDPTVSDDPNVLNITLTYTGGGVSNDGATNLNLGTLSAYSTLPIAGFAGPDEEFEEAIPTNPFTATSRNNSSGGTTPQENFGFVQGPGISAIPEPGTMLLLGTGLGIMAMRRRQRRKTSVV